MIFNKKNLIILFFINFALFLFFSIKLNSKTDGFLFLKFNSYKNDFNLCKIKKFKRLIFSDSLGVVEETRLIDLSDAYAPYNPALIEDENGYELIYREDEILFKYKKKIKFISKLFKTHLDSNFKQISKSYRINTGSDYSEDPRLISVNKQHILVYNDRTFKENKNARSLFVKNLNKSNESVNKLDLGLNVIEKNWSPFKHDNNLFFVYKIIPHKVLRLVDLDKNEIEFLYNQYDGNELDFWKWGEPRGGTPCIELENEYLTFFHSSFKQNETLIYVIGAYTFSKKHPFKINKFTPCPILFKEAYSSCYKNTAESHKRVLFPSGLVRDVSNHKLFLCCGENDSAIRLIKIDEKKLLNFMVDVPACSRNVLIE